MIGDGKRDYEAGINAGVKRSIMIEQNAPNALLHAVEEILSGRNS
jgi:hypothetical protein